tara:strand:- start:411 stop:1058 length:648 start_codon:yes stop_codon:yes gene_type:complete
LSNISIEKSLIEETKKKYIQKLGLNEESAFHNWLESNALSNEDFEEISLSQIRIKKFCSEKLDHKIEAHFLERKENLDVVVYSLIRVQDFFKAREFYLRIKDNEADFGQIAANHSEGIEKKTRGIVGPYPIKNAHPLLAQQLRTHKVGKVISPFEIDGSFLVARVEYYERATLNDLMREKMREELFNIFIESEVEEKNQELLKKTGLIKVNEDKK